MPTIQTTNNVDLVVNVAPDPLAGRPGSHTSRFDNNNPWIAAIGSASVTVRDRTAAQLDLVIKGSRVRSCTFRVGNIGPWRSSTPITMAVEPVAGATSSGEYIDTICSVARAPLAPNLPPPRAYPLSLSAYVAL